MVTLAPRILARRLLTTTSPSRLARPTMSFHFASQEYAHCFVNLPVADPQRLRTDTLAALERWDPQQWYDDPVRCKSQGLVDWSESYLMVLLDYYTAQGSATCRRFSC